MLTVGAHGGDAALGLQIGCQLLPCRALAPARPASQRPYLFTSMTQHCSAMFVCGRTEHVASHDHMQPLLWK